MKCKECGKWIECLSYGPTSKLVGLLVESSAASRKHKLCLKCYRKQKRKKRGVRG